MRLLIFLLLLATAQTADPPAVTGEVRAPDGSPVTQGTVGLMSSPTSFVTARLDRTGRFRVAPDSTGRQRLFISVPGYAPHRVNVTVPPSRRMALPPITLLEATEFTARFVTPDGEPLAAGGLRRQSIDGDGLAIPDPLGHVRERIEADGSVRIGPLPPGRTLMAFDRPGFAQTRLRDVDVNGTQRVIDGGTIVIAPPSRLEIAIVDGRGQPVPRHEVWIEDAVQPSPLFFLAVKTNDEGVAVFERLSARRYRVWTRSERCNGIELPVARLVSPGRTRIQIGGRATIRVMSAAGPLIGRPVGASPDVPARGTLQRLPTYPVRREMVPATTPPFCTTASDREGRVTITPIPPGPTLLRVHLFTSAYIARVTVPDSGEGEITVLVPDGLIPVRVTNRVSGQPIPSAQATWVGGGGRVQATATTGGDLLLEGIGAGGGTLSISARDYQTLEGAFEEAPDTQQEVSLVPLSSGRMLVRVVSSEGASIAGAIVELAARHPGEAAEFVVADGKGIAVFGDVPPGALQVTAYAEGFANASVRVTEEARAAIVIVLRQR